MTFKKNKGLLFAYILDKSGAGKKVSWEDVLAWTPDKGLLWVHLDYTCDIAKKWLETQSGLKKTVRYALTVDESRPRSLVEKEGTLLFLRGVNLNPGQEAEDMVSIRIWSEKNRVITTRRRKLLSVLDIEESIHREEGPKSSAELVTLLAERLTDRMSDVVEKINDRLDDLEDSGESEKISDARRAVSDFRRESIMIRRYLSPQREAINRLIPDQSGFFSPIDLMQLREVSDRVQRYIEDLDSVRDRAAVIQEELSTRLSEQINSRMYILSLVTVIFLPLSFITGLLGINVAGIPGEKYPHAFWVVVILLALLSGIFLLLFRKKKWV